MCIKEETFHYNACNPSQFEQFMDTRVISRALLQCQHNEQQHTSQSKATEQPGMATNYYVTVVYINTVT